MIMRRFAEKAPAPQNTVDSADDSSDGEDEEESTGDESADGCGDEEASDNRVPPEETQPLNAAVPPEETQPLNAAEVRWSERDARRRLLNDHQVLASAHFVRRMQLFMKCIVKHKPLLGGTLTDYVIRFETQGRGSVHAHMLWWIDINPDYIGAADVIALPDELLRAFALVKEKPDGELFKLYNETKLSYTNAHIWALQKAENIRKKLRIGIPEYETLRYAFNAASHCHLYSPEEQLAVVEEEKRYTGTDASSTDPMSVSFNCLPARISQCSEMQRHRCGEGCLIRKWSLLQCKQKGFDPTKQHVKDLTQDQVRELMKCKKNFPKTVPVEFGQQKAHVIMDYTKIVRYNPPRDDPMINNYNPMIAHYWNANTDVQMLHGEGM